MNVGDIVVLDTFESFIEFFKENPKLKWRFLGGLETGNIMSGSFFGGMDARIITEDIWKKELRDDYVVILEMQEGEKEPILFSLLNIKTYDQHTIKQVRNDRSYTWVSNWIGSKYGEKITPREMISIIRKYKPILEKHNII